MNAVLAFLIGGMATILVAVWLGRDSVRHGVITAIVGCVGLAAYGFAGTPGLRDMPYLKRQAELVGRDPATMTLEETLSRLEHLTQEQPDDPKPHFFTGELLKSQGRDADAMQAYRSALRRDSDYVPALIGLADAATRLEKGHVGSDTQAIYARAIALDSEQLRAGFMVGLSDWQAGRKTEAEAVWNDLKQLVPEDDPRAIMLDQWVATATSVQ